MAENTKVTSEEVKEEKVETAKTSNTTKKKELLLFCNLF